jgi:5'-3' exonuclease
MGIERFFNSLDKVEKIKSNGIIMGLKEKIKSNYIYIDFNSVIHNISSEIEIDINYLLYSILLNLESPDENPLDEYSLEIINKYYYDIYENSGIIKKWFDISQGITLENFKNTFPKQYIDEIVLTKIKEQIIYITTKLINPTDVKFIYIAFDGVPQMSKVVEQKKRRYNSFVVGELKKKIYEETKHTFSEIRNIYEENKIGLDRGRISTHDPLMERVTNMLKHSDFKNEMKLLNPSLEKLIISLSSVYGEGEKKIIENL